MRVLLLAEGDPNSPMQSGSGTPASLVSGLRSLGVEVLSADVELYGSKKLLAAASTYSATRARWVAKYRLSSRAHKVRSANAREAVRRAGRLDAILQYGATFDASGMGVPVFLFCDSNTKFSARRSPSWGSSLSPHQLSEVVTREQNQYRSASAIFTMSRYIAKSFQEDFGLEPRKVVVVGAGPNADATELTSIQRVAASRAAPTILFIGREFERKGGTVLAEAFQRVRRVIPDCRLLVVGPRERVALPDGAEWLGFLDRTAPSDWRILKEAFEAATVFALPALHEPFGLVVLEAMYAGLPVVATSISALEEMVVAGDTGYLVPPSDPDRLEAALLSVLRDPLAHEMGLRGRLRAREHYSWDRVARLILERMRETVAVKNPSA